jgi:hypothetical protein
MAVIERLGYAFGNWKFLMAARTIFVSYALRTIKLFGNILKDTRYVPHQTRLSWGFFARSKKSDLLSYFSMPLSMKEQSIYI